MLTRLASISRAMAVGTSVSLLPGLPASHCAHQASVFLLRQG